MGAGIDHQQGAPRTSLRNLVQLGHAQGGNRPAKNARLMKPSKCKQPAWEGVFAQQSSDENAWAAFRAECRRRMKWPVRKRLKHGFLPPVRPVPDGVLWRSFKSMAEYRDWCDKNLSADLGFKKATR